MAFFAKVSIHEDGRIKSFHILLLFASLVLTLTAWQLTSSQIEKRITNRFEVSRDRTIALISDTMSRYEDALWAGVATVKSHEDAVSYDNWHSFAETLHLGDRHPGINGVGIIRFIPQTELPDYLARERVTRPDFSVFPEHDDPLKMPITFIEPEDINAKAVGLDVAHEQNRRTAALASADTATAQITGPIVLVQDANSTPGFLFYVPFYRNGVVPDPATRRENTLGLVYAPFVVHKLMAGVLSKESRMLRISISDGEEVLYDEHSKPDATRDSDPMHAEKIVLSMYGRDWLLDIRTNLEFRQSNSYTEPTLLLIAGLIIECLIIALLVMISRANRKAISYADKVTAELRMESERLSDANAVLSQRNEEIAQFSYVASHDLKTPIRGISGLTEMLEEDLEPYLQSEDANPEVSQNLQHIKERVSRMEDLTHGILEYSQIGNDDMETTPIDLERVLKELVFDFELAANQLQLAGDVSVVRDDTVNFRRVLENLIGNAIKYHDGVKPLRIIVTGQANGSWCHFSVKDNGPGIEEKYQDRIFDVFQTLRLSGAPESTGIGLSIVKKSVARHRGTVTLDSAPGKGANFSFTWPYTTADHSDLDQRDVA